MGVAVAAIKFKKKMYIVVGDPRYKFLKLSICDGRLSLSPKPLSSHSKLVKFDHH